MTSFVRSERIADCPYSVAAQYTLRFLSSDAAAPFASGLSFSVQYDVGDGARGHNEIRFSWRARSRGLPDVAGVLQLSIDTHRTTRITLDGTYEPPFGPLGALFDAAIGKRVSTALANDFVQRVCAALEAEERAFRLAHPSAS